MLHEDFKLTYSGQYNNDFARIMDAYAEYLAYVLGKFSLNSTAVDAQLQAYRIVSGKSKDKSVLAAAFFRSLMPARQTLTGWRQKSLTELAEQVDIESHQAKHYDDSSQNNVAKFNLDWNVVHNLMRAGVVAAAPVYQEKGFTCFPDAVCTVVEGGRVKTIGKDGKPSGAGSDTVYFRIQISPAPKDWPTHISAHGYPISEPEYKAYKKKKIDLATGVTDPARGVTIGAIEFNWTAVAAGTHDGDVKYKLR